MTLFFTRIPYAVTLTDGELVDENYSGHDPLVCEFCGVPMERIIGPDDSQHYQHVLHGQSAAIKAMHCKYRHYLSHWRVTTLPNIEATWRITTDSAVGCESNTFPNDDS